MPGKIGWSTLGVHVRRLHGGFQLFGISRLLGSRGKSLPTLLGELKQLTITYTKQETLDPLKSLGRFIGWGVAGSVLLGIGMTLWVLAALRALQTETDTWFTGDLTWAPYIITLVACVIVIFFAVHAIKKDRRDLEKRKAERAARETSAAS